MNQQLKASPLFIPLIGDFSMKLGINLAYRNVLLVEGSVRQFCLSLVKLLQRSVLIIMIGKWNQYPDSVFIFLIRFLRSKASLGKS